MGTKLSKVPKNETELRELLQNIYLTAKSNYENKVQCNFTGILEIIMCEPNIVSAIHKIKANKGSQTPGVDERNIRDYLEKNYDDIINLVRDSIKNYKPNEVKRVWIPKPGKVEKRPLGIPTIIDRIIQECFRNILEPIAEGQFFEHSYGFRPMRSASMAVARIKAINYTAKCNWVVEGDIKGFFDNIDHNVMIKSMWNLGIRDKRVLSIVKQMLRAGIMGECSVSEMGTPQGGIISPLLANIYLNRFDNYMIGDFEHKRLRKPHSRHDGEITAMRNHSNLKTCYFVRYADDWVILTDSKESAEKLRFKAKKFLGSSLKLELSEEKTLITNVRVKAICFLGVEIKMVKTNDQWVNYVSPDRKRFYRKMQELKREIFFIRKTPSRNKERLFENITRVNSQIAGLINYYSMCDKISVAVRKYSWRLKYTAYKSLKKYGGQWVRAKDVSNLIGLHTGRNTRIPAILFNDRYVGITDLAFASWVNPRVKNQKETPYTPEGIELYYKRMRKKGLRVRVDEVNSSTHAMMLRRSKHKLYNFEYFMNRPYAYSRDKGKCRLCNGYVEPNGVNIHHINPSLPTDQINRVKNLASMHPHCHKLIHSKIEPSNLSDKTLKKLAKYREQLNNKTIKVS